MSGKFLAILNAAGGDERDRSERAMLFYCNNERHFNKCHYRRNPHSSITLAGLRKALASSRNSMITDDNRLAGASLGLS